MIKAIKWCLFLTLILLSLPVGAALWPLMWAINRVDPRITDKSHRLPPLAPGDSEAWG